MKDVNILSRSLETKHNEYEAALGIASAAIVENWVLVAKSAMAIIDEKTYTVRGFKNSRDYFAVGHPQHKYDPDRIFHLVTVYRKFKDVISSVKMPLQRWEKLISAPDEFQQMLKDDKKELAKLAASSPSEYEKSVGEAKKTTDTRTPEKPTTKKLLVNSPGATKVTKKLEKAGIDRAVEHERWRNSVVNRVRSIHIELASLMDLVKDVGPHAIADCVDKPVLQEIQNFLDIVVEGAQHGLLAEHHLEQFVKHIRTHAKRIDKEDLAREMGNYSEAFAGCRKAIAEYDALAASAHAGSGDKKVVSITAVRKAASR